MTESVKVIFSTEHGIVSSAIRFALFSQWSHCAIIDGDNAIESSMGVGVRTRLLSDFIAESKYTEIIEIPVESASAVIDAAKSQIGKPYDLRGVIGIELRRKWNEPDAWFCSELIAWSFEKAGHPLFRQDAWRITPRDLYIRTY